MMKANLPRRGSRQKQAVLETVVSCSDHPTADEVFSRVRIKLPGISLSTVYRNLGILVDEGRLITVSGPGAELHYDHSACSHCHVQCRSCGRVCDVQFAPIDFRLLLPTDAAGFKIDGVSVTFTGICTECAEPQKTGDEYES